MIHISVHITRNSNTPPTPPPARVVGWRALHVAEGGRVPDPLGSPGVIPPFNPTVALEMTRDIQLMSYDLMSYFHPAVAADRNRWRICHGNRFAMNNRTGYDDPDNPVPRRDYVNNIDVTADQWPKYDKMQRTFSGSLITGMLGYSVMATIAGAARMLRQMAFAPRSFVGRFRKSFASLSSNNVIWCTPGVDAIDARGFVYEPGTPEAAATLAEIIDRRWFSYAVGETADGAYRIKDHWTPAGIVVFPLILDRPVSYLASYFVAWDETYAPEPTKIYV